MKTLTFSTLYPNSVSPNHGIFVETRLRHLLESGRVETRVIAPIPWFPWRSARFGRYSAFARVPGVEERNGIRVHHPRYLSVPRVGMTISPSLLACCAGPALQRLLDEPFEFDLIDSHYFYPDGVSAVVLGRRLGKPVLITARGSDINLIARYALPRRMIQWAARHADGIVAVSAALKAALIELGVSAERIEVLRNGVDLRLFRPGGREEQRSRLAVRGRVLITVGNLVPLKGHDIAIRALERMPGVTLLVVGGGPEESSLKSLAAQLGLEDRVRFLGTLSQPQVRDCYVASDALVLMSSREGMPNVLLESMACGTPVLATRVGGTPEIVCSPEAGLLLPERTPEALAMAVDRLFAGNPRAEATRRYAERFGWEGTTRGQLALFDRVLDARRRPTAYAVGRP